MVATRGMHRSDWPDLELEVDSASTKPPGSRAEGQTVPLKSEGICYQEEALQADMKQQMTRPFLQEQSPLALPGPGSQSASFSL